MHKTPALPAHKGHTPHLVTTFWWDVMIQPSRVPGSAVWGIQRDLFQGTNPSSPKSHACVCLLVLGKGGPLSSDRTREQQVPEEAWEIGSQH